jgi:hypothetical protein
MTPPELPILGGCACGAVRFEISAPLGRAAYCHCTRCQRRTGSGAGASALVPPGSFSVVAGPQEIRTWVPDGGFAKHFCGLCGSGLFANSPDDPDALVVRLGSIDGDPGVRPELHQFTRFAAAWEPVPDDGLPRFEERAA